MEQKKDLRKFLQDFSRFIKPHKAQISFMYIFAITNVLTMILIPILIRTGIDNGIITQDISYIIKISLLLVFIAIIQFFSFRIQGVLVMKIGNKVLYALRKELFNHIQKLSISFFDKNKAGSLMTRVTNDVTVLEELLMSGLDSLVVDVLMIIGLISAMVWLNGWLSLVLLFVIPVLFIIVFKLRKKIIESAEDIQKSLSIVNSHLNESLSGIQVSRAFARENKNIEAFKEENKIYFNQCKKFYPLHAYFWQSVSTLNTFSQGLVIIGGGILLFKNMITIGVIVAFLSYITRLFQPMQKISNMLNQLSRAMVSGNRIFEVLNEEPAVANDKNSITDFKLKGNVEFKDVFFRYKEDEPVLNGINFNLDKGNTCAIVGHTGSGKSTIVNLINRFYDIQSGSILIDGIDIKSYDKQSLRSQMSTVMQEPQIFSGSVYDNISFGKPEATLSEVKEIAQKLGIDKMIESFPNAYNTEMGQGGGNISLGQKQLLAFARALIRNPKILILDEASAYLDTETEAIVQKAMGLLMQGRSSFVIAHRLSTIRNADQIIVVEDGKIVERGDHRELIQLNGVYAELLKNLQNEKNYS